MPARKIPKIAPWPGARRNYKKKESLFFVFFSTRRRAQNFIRFVVVVGGPGVLRGGPGADLERPRADFPEGPSGPAGVVPGITADLRYLISGVPLGYGDLRSSLNSPYPSGCLAWF